jgi:hypothetical protein
MSQYSNHVEPDNLADDFDDLPGGIDLSQLDELEQRWTLPTPEAIDDERWTIAPPF